MNLKKGDVVKVVVMLEAGPLSSRGNVFKLPSRYIDSQYEDPLKLASWQVRCLFQVPPYATEGIVVGYGVRQVGVMAEHSEWGLDTYDYLESVSVVLVQPTNTQRWLKPMACMEEDLVLMPRMENKHVKPGWKLEPPLEKCPDCGGKIEPVAIHTGDAWALCWDCACLCQPEVLLETEISWPFVEDYAYRQDLEKIGFRIE